MCWFLAEKRFEGYAWVVYEFEWKALQDCIWFIIIWISQGCLKQARLSTSTQEVEAVGTQWITCLPTLQIKGFEPHRHLRKFFQLPHHVWYQCHSRYRPVQTSNSPLSQGNNRSSLFQYLIVLSGCVYVTISIHLFAYVNKLRWGKQMDRILHFRGENAL